jgi:hypothetical protein
MVNNSHIIGRATRLMKRPSVIESPFSRLPKKAPRWDLTRIEACGGRKLFFVCPLIYGEYLGIYRAEIRVRRATWGPQA